MYAGIKRSDRIFQQGDVLRFGGWGKAPRSSRCKHIHITARACMRARALSDLSLAENFQQLVVGQEIEAAESRPLSLQVVAEAFLNHVQELSALAELVQQLSVVAELDASGASGGKPRARDRIHSSR